MSNGIFHQNLPGRAVTVTPSDTAAVAYSMIYVGSTGDVQVTDSEGNVTLWKSVPTGQFIPVRATKVWATNTTATFMIGLG